MVFRVLFLFIGLSLSLGGGQAAAGSASIYICNRSDNPFQVAILEQSRYGGDLVWGVRGWSRFPARRCGYAGRIDDHWGGLAFVAGSGEHFKPFKFTPSRQYNNAGTPPGLSNVCVTKDDSDFSRGLLSGRDVATTCPKGQVEFIPISFFLQAGYSDTDVRLNVTQVPSTPRPQKPKVVIPDMSKWEGYVESCINDAINKFARTRERAIEECVCYAAATETSVAPSRHAYSYPEQINVPYETLPAEEQQLLKTRVSSCRDRDFRTQEDFQKIVTTLIAQRPKPRELPAEALQRGQMLGMTAYINAAVGPLELFDVQAGSHAETAYLKTGDVILSANNKEVVNLTELAEHINAAAARGQTTVSLSVKRAGGYFLTELGFR